MRAKINKCILNIWEAKHLVFNRDDLADKVVVVQTHVLHGVKQIQSFS